MDVTIRKNDRKNLHREREIWMIFAIFQEFAGEIAPKKRDFQSFRDFANFSRFLSEIFLPKGLRSVTSVGVCYN
jgi:hypothetical protein